MIVDPNLNNITLHKFFPCVYHAIAANLTLTFCDFRVPESALTTGSPLFLL